MNKMKVALATALNHSNWRVSRLCLVLLLFACSWQGSHAAYMYVKGTASPYYKIGDGSYSQMTSHINTSDGTIWYYADVDNGSVVTFASSSDGANASPAITFNASSDSYFYYNGGTGINLTSQKTETACFYFSAGSWWTNDNAVFRCHMWNSNATTTWPGVEGTVVGGNSNTTIYAFTQSFIPTGIKFTRLTLDNNQLVLRNETSNIEGSNLSNGAYYIVNNVDNNGVFNEKNDTYVVANWPSKNVFTGNLYLIGNANDNTWKPNVGVEMTAMNSENTIFMASNVHLMADDATNNNGFAFATMLSGSENDWSLLNTHRLGSNGDGNRWNITENLLNQWNNNLQVDYGYEKNFVVDVEGNYDVEVNLETMQVKVTYAPEPVSNTGYNGPGYYRLQNAQTLRYANAVDNKGMEINQQTGVNSPSLNSIDLVAGDPTSLPGSIIYICETDEIPIFGQGLDLQTQGIGTMMLTRFLLQNMEGLIAGLIGGSGSVNIDPEEAQMVAGLPGVPVHIEEQADGTYIAYIQASLDEDSQPIKANFVDVEGNQAHFGRNFDILMYGNGKNKWNVIPVNETDNYFTVTPSQTAVDGKYYTTLSVDFGYKILSEGVTAYIVTDVDNDGNPTLSQIATTNGLVARGASVVLEASSPNDIKLLPMDGGDPALLEGNQLSIAIDEEHLNSYYAEERNIDTESFATLADGTIAFTKFFADGEMLPANKAFYDKSYKTLQWIIKNGDNNTKYRIKDNLQVAYAYYNPDVSDDVIIFAKDDNNCPDDERSVNSQNAVDYMASCYIGSGTGLFDDQSNWIEIHLPYDDSTTDPTSLESIAESYFEPGYGVGHVLSQNIILTNVRGTYMKNGGNPILNLQSYTKKQSTSSINVNTYITANFYELEVSEYNDNAVYQNGFFFIKPKAQEVAYFDWAVFDGTNFVIPKKGVSENGNINGFDLQGGFSVDLTYTESNNCFSDGKAYSFYGVVRKKGGSKFEYNQDEPINSEYEVWPFYIDGQSNGVVTSVASVNAERKVVAIEYVNLAGQRSTTPWQGVNIVVTRYTDGTTKSTKAIM